MNSISRAYYWVLHYLNSNTLHGTHSPFVYSFLEDIVYQNSEHLQKNIGLFFRIAKSIPKSDLLFLNTENATIEDLSPLNKNILLDTHDVHYEKLGLVFFGAQMQANEMHKYYFQFIDKIDSSTIFIFENIANDLSRKKMWNLLCNEKSNNISIDLLHTGIMFFDSKKPKEHFMIYY